MTVRAIALLTSIALAAPAEAQTLNPPTGEPPSLSISTEAISPQDLTEPNQLIECDVQSIDGRNHSFALRYQGQRGYIDPDTGRVQATNGRVIVARDESNLFSSYARWSSAQNRFEAHSDRDDATFGPHVRLQMERTDFERERATGTTWAILVQAQFHWMPLTKSVGFCRVENTHQQPLSEAEAREHVRRAGLAPEQ